MIPELYVGDKRVPNIVRITPGPEPLWGDGTGRKALDGHYSGVFIGYFTTLAVDFGPCSKETFDEIKQLLEHPYVNNVRYRLEKTMSWVDSNNVSHTLPAGEFFTENFYNGQAIKAPENFDLSVNEFSVALTAIDRRPQLI